MKVLCFLIAALSFGSVRASTARDQSPVALNADVVAAVTAADDERLAATKSGDRLRLEAIFSDGLRYAHSNGKIDSKSSFIEALVSRKTIYETFEYRERTFTPVAPGIVLMTGHLLAHLRSGGQPIDLDINFLAVWREEGGHWRFLAWQSSKNPPPPSAK